MNTAVHFSSATDLWSTPQDFFDELDREFGFTLDPCATDDNHKTDKYFTKETDGLAQDWSNEVVFMNPPYGREIGAWVKKAAESNTTVVCLIPARPDTRWWHKYIWDKTKHKPYKGVQLRFNEGRLKFGGHSNSAPFPSSVVVFKNRDRSMQNSMSVLE